MWNLTASRFEFLCLNLRLYLYFHELLRFSFYYFLTGAPRQSLLRPQQQQKKVFIIVNYQYVQCCHEVTEGSIVSFPDNWYCTSNKTIVFCSQSEHRCLKTKVKTRSRSLAANNLGPRALSWPQQLYDFYYLIKTLDPCSKMKSCSLQRSNVQAQTLSFQSIVNLFLSLELNPLFIIRCHCFRFTATSFYFAL